MTVQIAPTPIHEEDDMDRIDTTIGVSLRRALLVGGLLGAASVWAVATAVALRHGVDSVEALALGAFVGLWGGGGLGSMVAASIPLSRYLPSPVAARAAGGDRPSARPEH
jgi:hypothetical protein